MKGGLRAAFFVIDLRSRQQAAILILNKDYVDYFRRIAILQKIDVLSLMPKFANNNSQG
jgi:hypothetical protein